MSFTNANKRFAGQKLAEYSPERKGGGRQFNSPVKPVLTSSSTYNSAEEALYNNGYKYRDADGVVRRLKVQEVPGVKDTYRIAKDGTQEAKGAPKLAINSSKDTRRLAAQASTADDNDTTLAAIKYQNINDKNKQAHHLTEVVEHGAAFLTRPLSGREAVRAKLAQHGFFTGDDRRQYVALTGNKMYNADGTMQLTGHLDEHQGYVHTKDSVAGVVQSELLPTEDQFAKMSDEEAAQNVLMSGLAARLDVQKVKGVAPAAISKTERDLRIATAKAIAARLISEPFTQTKSTLMPG